MAILLAGIAVSMSYVPAMGQTGEPTTNGNAVAVEVARESTPTHTEADVRFMQGMIRHHEQALEMTRLVPERTSSERIRLLAERIEVSQKDEIDLMRRWLADRGEGEYEHFGDLDKHGHHGDEHGHHRERDEHEHHGDEPGHHHERDEHHGDEGDHRDHERTQHRDEHGLMPGMLTADEMIRLAEATDVAFDSLFLEFMLFHHEGALVMVHELFSAPGAAQEPEIFRFASDVDADQRAEMRRMMALLDALGPQTTDP